MKSDKEPIGTVEALKNKLRKMLELNWDNWMWVKMEDLGDHRC